MPRTVAAAIASGSMCSIPQPTLAVDDELTLRPFRFADVDRMIEAMRDPAIQHWHSRRIDSVTEARAAIGYCHQVWLTEESADFAIVGSDDRLLGRVALHTFLPAATGEIAYWLLPDARGNGVATRAGRALTRWGHEHLGIHRIVLEHAVGNEASCGVARSLGYELECTARGVQLLTDGWNDVHRHAHIAGD